MILDLVYPHKSELGYRINRFPDGQQDVVIESIVSDDMYIKSRLNSFSDLELIICAVKALRNMGTKNINLYIPYMLGARSDRKFVDGGTRYLSQVIVPIINSLKLNWVTVVDPHSDILENILDNIDKLDNTPLVKWATRDICGPVEESGPNSKYPFILISPDAGAQKKIFNVAEKIGFSGSIVTASKHRNLVTGEILGTDVPIPAGFSVKPVPYVIIDDICDGGRTFIEIAKEIHKQHAIVTDVKPIIYLIVTHGIFSAKDAEGNPDPFTELKKYFTKVYCTNSVKDIKDEPFVQQLNIF